MKFLCLALVLSSAAAMNAPSAAEFQALDAHIKGLSLVPGTKRVARYPGGTSPISPKPLGRTFLIFYSYE